jgi:hypothetical protein
VRQNSGQADSWGRIVMLFLSIGAIALFSFLAVASWSDNRRKERSANYRSETIRKIEETASPGSTAPLDYTPQAEQINARHRRESIRLAA